MNFLDVLEKLNEAEGKKTFKCPGCKKTTKVGTCEHCGKNNSLFDTKKKRGGGTQYVVPSMRPRKTNEELNEGSLKSAVEQIAKHTDENYHTLALIAGLKFLQSNYGADFANDIKKLQALEKEHDIQGSLPKGGDELRSKINKKMYNKAKEVLNKEELKQFCSGFNGS